MSERIDLNNFKVITDKLNTYFKNNQFMVGSSIPNVGTYKVGDIIVNNGNNATEIPMWICTEAGTPGTWEVFNSGGMEETELENYITNIVQSQAISAVDYTDGMDIQIDGKDYSSDIGQLNNLQTSNKDNLVAAINELFQNANNGKELIASAIGEPLDASDTFQAMSNDINGLLSQFKTNMMNSGVTVEANDRFKQLIDKIKGLTEGEGNKGIQFAQGNRKQISVGTLMDEGISVDIDFEPMFLFLAISNRNTPSYTTSSYHGGIGTLGVAAICISDLICADSSRTIGLGSIGNGYQSSYYYDIIFNTGLTDGKITVKERRVGSSWIYGYPTVDYDWYAIGIGEEDTTLRDSLASILQEEGVNVTEEDDMASLIGKVDQEFDNKNANSGLDIISATELPATGKENQICVITDNPVDKYYASSIYEDIQSINSEHIGIYLVDYKPENIYNGSTISVGDTFKIDYNIARFIQDSNRLPAYIYKNNAWEEFYIPAIYLLEDKVMQNTDIFGNIVNSNTTAKVSYTSGTGININGSCHASLSNSIDFSLYKSVIITAYCTYNVTRKITISQLRGTSAGIGDPSSTNIVKSASLTFSASPTTVTCDISSWTGTGYFCLSNDTMAPGQYFYITDIFFV